MLGNALLAYREFMIRAPDRPQPSLLALLLLLDRTTRTATCITVGQKNQCQYAGLQFVERSDEVLCRPRWCCRAASFRTLLATPSSVPSRLPESPCSGRPTDHGPVAWYHARLHMTKHVAFCVFSIGHWGQCHEAGLESVGCSGQGLGRPRRHRRACSSRTLVATPSMMPSLPTESPCSGRRTDHSPVAWYWYLFDHK